MNAIRENVRIQTTAARAYDALTTQAGVRGWWNTVAEVGGAVGGDLRLLFHKGGVPVRMVFRIDEQVPLERVRWTCVEHDHGPWVGTTVTWTLRADGGAVAVDLEHAGWKEAPQEMVVQGWKHFAGSLKAYLETGAGQPG